MTYLTIHQLLNAIDDKTEELGFLKDAGEIKAFKQQLETRIEDLRVLVYEIEQGKEARTNENTD